MSLEGQGFYPGERAAARDIALLAIEYHRAAIYLSRTGRPGEALSRAPFRLTALHALELYLNAFLLAAGYRSVDLRKLHHDLDQRAQQADRAGLRLRRRTLSHLRVLSDRREYLISRYDPTMSGLSELNRLDATLREVAEKVTKALDRTT